MKWFTENSELDFIAVRESSETEEILHVFSDVDIASSKAFDALLGTAPLRHKRMLVDLTECPYMDLTGLRSLIGAHNAFGPGLQIRVTSNSLVEKLLAASGFDQILCVVATAQTRLLQL